MVGIMSPPTAAVVAGPEPEIAEKSMHARMVTWARPPRTLPTKQSATEMRRLLMPPFSMSAPASRNMGTAMKGNLSSPS